MAQRFASKCSTVGHSSLGSLFNNSSGLLRSSHKIMGSIGCSNFISQQHRTFIQMGTKLKVVDNSGAKIVKCIRVIKGSSRKGARLGDTITASVKQGCEGISDLKMGMQVHGYLVVVGLKNECVSGLCNIYFRCRKIVLGERVFREREGRNALLEHIMMDFKSEDGIVIISALIDMYCKCPSMGEARQSLRVVSCNKIKDNEITPALSSLFYVLKELKWRPDTRSLLSLSLGGTGVGKKGGRFFKRRTGKAPIILNMSTFIILGTFGVAHYIQCKFFNSNFSLNVFNCE
ncbi:hypothetical protein GIB67_041824 [Kingdonia uniflora]|uniref:Ribosomal protein L14 n=1 Tax=Kingdonia uniflora TaxID=39325 RepID=A0A7J7L5N3_9MAGN|nr:hypothetical protein GIB67_041824 [Kingdonia uniflora]